MKVFKYDDFTTLSALHSERESTVNLIQQIERMLPYADGGAYSQDKERIRELKAEINKIDAEIKKLTFDINLELHGY
jgi:peptidoglycan hydrolase CwlO-like protein